MSVPAWLAVAAKDLRVEARSRETLVPVLLTALAVVVVGLLAFHHAHEQAATGAAVVWTALSLASALGLARAFGAERDRNTLDTLLMLPLGRVGLYAGKAAAAFATLLASALVVVPAYLLASGDAVAPRALAGLAALVALGALGLAATGTILSLLATHARSRDLLLPVLLFPLLVPLLVSSVHGTMDVLAGEPFAAWRPELLFLVGYDVAFLAAGALLMEQVVGA